MTLEEALKWADNWGPLQSDPPNGDAPALLRLAGEVRRLQRGEFICQKCGLRKDSEHEAAHDF